MVRTGGGTGEEMIGVGGRGGSSYQKIRRRRIFSLGVAAHERLAVAIRAFDFAALKATEVREPRAGRGRPGVTTLSIGCVQVLLNVPFWLFMNSRSL